MTVLKSVLSPVLRSVVKPAETGNIVKYNGVSVTYNGTNVIYP